MMRLIPKTAIILCLAGAPLPAEVIDSAPNGFTISIVGNLQAPPHEVYQKIVHNVGDWWSPQHTFSRDPHNLSIDDRAMGCFCERLPNGGSARHMEVLNIVPDNKLVMAGALGPLQSLAVTGVLTIVLTPADGGTKLSLTYAVAGYLPKGLDAWATPVNGVLDEQLTRLRNYVDGHAPAPQPK